MKELIPALREIHQKGQRKERLTFEEMILLLFEGVINLGWPDERINLRFKPASIHGPINKILLIQLSSIGDVIYVTPVIPGLKEKFPKANLTFLVEETAKDIVTDNPGIDEVLLFPERRLLKEIQEGNYQKVIREIGLFAKKLRESQFDLAINLHTSPRSAGFTYLSGAKNISGLTLDESGLPFTCGSPWMFYKYFVGCNPVMAGLNPLNLVELSIKMAEVNPGVRETKVFIPPATEEKISQILSSFGVKEDDLLVGLNPGSNFACRRWIEEEFACLADLLDREYRAKIIIFGGPGDVELAKRIAQPMQARPINLAGKTNLKELAALISRCDHLITGDTGPMHLAGAVKTPTIVVAGPTRDGPYGCENHLLLQANLPCVGCGPTSKCEKKDCMKAIKAGDVLAALRYQRGEIQNAECGMRNADRINVYISGSRPPERLFDYYPLKPARDGQTREHLLKLVQLNLWIKESAKLGYKEELLTHEEIMEHLARHYHSSVIPHSSFRIPHFESTLSAYQSLCRQGIERLKEVLGLLATPSLLLPGIEEFNKIDSLMVDRQQKDLTYKLFAFYDFVYPKESEEIEKSLRRYLKIYLAKRKACGYLGEFLKECGMRNAECGIQTTPLRVLALRTQGNILPVIFEDAVAGFRQLGHKVREISLTNLLELKKEVGDFKPDLVFITNWTFPGIFRDYLVSRRLVHASYFADDPLLWAKNESASAFTYLFVWDRSYIESLKRLGFGKVFHLPLAANPEIFTDDRVTGEERERFGCQISFVGGSLYSYLEEAEKWRNVEGEPEEALRVVLETAKSSLYRAEMANSVADFGLNLYGDDGWIELLKQEGLAADGRRWTQMDTDFNFKGMADNRTELPLIYKASKINLNLTRPQLRTALNMRVFDICACGGFLLTDYREDLEKLFDLNSEIACFHNKDELRDKAKYYLKHSEERREKARAAKRRVLKEHTYKERMRSLIDIIYGF